jgi:hypothetical protein
VLQRNIELWHIVEGCIWRLVMVRKVGEHVGDGLLPKQRLIGVGAELLGEVMRACEE